MDHTIALIQKSHEGDEEAKAQIVEENTGLIWCIVKRFRGRGAEVEDLFQIGSIGLLKAIDKFDLSYEAGRDRPTLTGIAGTGIPDGEKNTGEDERKNLKKAYPDVYFPLGLSILFPETAVKEEWIWRKPGKR